MFLFQPSRASLSLFWSDSHRAIPSCRAVQITQPAIRNFPAQDHSYDCYYLELFFYSCVFHSSGENVTNDATLPDVGGDEPAESIEQVDNELTISSGNFLSFNSSTDYSCVIQCFHHFLSFSLQI